MRPPLGSILLLVTLAACAGDKVSSTVPIARSVDGTYTLQIYNGLPLPSVAWADTTKIELISGSLVLRGDDTYSNHMLHKMTEPNGAVRTVDNGLSGTFQVRTEYRGNGSYIVGTYASDTTVVLSPVCCVGVLSIGVLSIGVLHGRSITIAQGMPLSVFTK